MLRSAAKQLSRRLYSSESAVSNDLQGFMRVSTIDQPSNGARLTLMVGTGSRDDTLSTLGTTHAMQAGAVLSGKQNTAFLTTQVCLINF